MPTWWFSLLLCGSHRQPAVSRQRGQYRCRRRSVAGGRASVSLVWKSIDSLRKRRTLERGICNARVPCVRNDEDGPDGWGYSDREFICWRRPFESKRMGYARKHSRCGRSAGGRNRQSHTH